MANGKRIVISTYGSFGDVHPYIAIARASEACGTGQFICILQMCLASDGAR